MRAFVLVITEAHAGPQVQQSIKSLQIEGVKVPIVNQVAGTFDLIAVIEAESPHAIGVMIINHIQKIQGILATTTLLAIG